jgi:DNA-binding NtrC family response regulator
MIRVLLVDDELQLIEAFKKQLTREGMHVITASYANEALAIVKEESVDVGVLDIKLPDVDGVELLLKLKQIEPTLEVVMLTAYASVDTAIRSMKLGAYDYLTKPCKISELQKVILKAYEKKTLKEKNIVLAEHLHRIGIHDDFIGESEQIKKVKTLISVVSASDMPVLILGETGTGKELTARAIHDQSQRSGNPFVVINASALQDTILESELFGYKKGAFTGAQNDKLGLIELANNGTLFMDEVGDMGLPIQAKVLRVLEAGTFMKLGDTKETRADVRFIFATNKELKTEIKEGRFRKDLYFRMNAFIISLPPLREKREDIPLLAKYFLDKYTRGNKRKRFSQEAIELLTSYGWPGNVRELANVIERAVLISAHEEIIVDDFPEAMLDVEPQDREQETLKSRDAILKLDRLGKEHIKRVLNSVGGNKAKAARLLGITRKTLYSKIRKGPT